MKLHSYFFFCVLACATASAQTPFTVSSLPSRVGESNCSYYSTNVDISAMLALTSTNESPGGPPTPGTQQYWDFSQPQQPNESVLRTDTIAPGNGANNGSFPSATYAEQDTMAGSSAFAWRYYGFTNSGASPGRLYMGFDEPQPDATPEAVFSPASTDIPATVQLGQTWSRSLSWEYEVYAYIWVPVSNYFTASATVDAYGTLVLPEIGTVPAFRVHEVHVYNVTDLEGMFQVDLNTNQYYYWLVPGIGVAAQVFLLGNNFLYPSPMPNTNTVERMYFTSYFTNSAPPPPVPHETTNLSIQLQGSSVYLSWSAFTNAASYRVQYTPALSNTNWQTLDLTSSNSCMDTLTSTQRFYRVVGIP